MLSAKLSQNLCGFGKVFFGSPYYVILYKAMILKLYFIAEGKNEYVPIFLDDKQIGQLCKENVVYRNLDWYMLFLLETHQDIAPLISLFTLYYDGFHHPTRVGNIARSKESWNFSKYRKLYNPRWLQKNFENTSPF